MFSFRSLIVLLWTGLIFFGLNPSGVWASESLSIQPYLDQVSNAVTEFTLDNGLKFIVLEQHQAPVISFMTYCNIGAADEPDGQTGVAHFLEHLAFKGTETIGTVNYPEEKNALDQLDRLFDQIQAAKATGQDSSALQTEFETWQKKAASYVKQNELGLSLIHI